MKTQVFKFSMDVSVHDAEELFAKALERAIEGGDTEADARWSLTSAPGTEYAEIDIGACLQMLFDPGVSPDGCTIEESFCEHQFDTGEDDEGDEDNG